MIHGYAERPSVLPGEELVLRVSTTAPSFHVRFERAGARREAMGTSGSHEGLHAPHHLPFHDWGEDGSGLQGEALSGWPAYRLPIPADWPSGVYLATLIAAGGGVQAQGEVLFVVRSGSPGTGARLLYKLPLFTYHAYNQVWPDHYDATTRRGGWCLYTVPKADELPFAVPPSVSLRRPGGGAGGTPWDAFNADPFDPTPRQTFAHWDEPAIAWLEERGYELDYCTDLDLHEDVDGLLLRAYRLLLSFGHDEYWSAEMRDHAERYVGCGGNIAFFCGNTCWWEIVFDDPWSYRRVRNWSDTPVPDRPENELTGVSFRNAGERGRNDSPTPVGFQVQHADHWVYEGTGLRDGERFGDLPEESLVGYECDGARFDRRDLEGGRPVRPTLDDGTPPSFTILGVGDVGAAGWGLGNRAATMGLCTPGGTVFTGSTTDWARVMARGPRPAVGQITRNVIDRLGG